jgi:hypothetical protein
MSCNLQAGMKFSCDEVKTQPIRLSLERYTFAYFLRPRFKALHKYNLLFIHLHYARKD